MNKNFFSSLVYQEKSLVSKVDEIVSWSKLPTETNKGHYFLFVLKYL